MPATADNLWREDGLEVSEGLMNAATGIAFGIGLGLGGWMLIFGLLWVTL